MRGIDTDPEPFNSLKIDIAVVHKFVAKVHGLTVEGPSNLLLGGEISRSAYLRMSGAMGSATGDNGVNKSGASKSGNWRDSYSLKAIGNKDKGKGKEKKKERGEETYKDNSSPMTSSSSSKRGSGRGSGGGSPSIRREIPSKTHQDCDLIHTSIRSHSLSPSPSLSTDSFSTPVRAVSAMRSSISSGYDNDKPLVRKVTFNFDENDPEFFHLRNRGGGEGEGEEEEVIKAQGDSDCSADSNNDEDNDEDEDDMLLLETTETTESGIMDMSLVPFGGACTDLQHELVPMGPVGTVDTTGAGSGSRSGSVFLGPISYLQDGHHYSDTDSGGEGEGEGVHAHKWGIGKERGVRVISRRSSISSEKEKEMGNGKGKGKRRKKNSIRAADVLDKKSKSMNMMVIIKSLADGTITAPILSGSSCPTVGLQNRETTLSKNYTLQLKPTDIDILFNASKASSAASGLAGTDVGAGGNMLNFKEFLVLLRFLGEKYFKGRSGAGPRANRPGGKISRKAQLDRGEMKTKNKESDTTSRDLDLSGDSSDGCVKVKRRGGTSGDSTLRVTKDIPDMRDIIPGMRDVRERVLPLTPNTPTHPSLSLSLFSAFSPSNSSTVSIDVHSTSLTAPSGTVNSAASIGQSAPSSPTISKSLWGSKSKPESRPGSRGVSAGGLRCSSSAGERRRERERERESESQRTVCRVTEITGDGEDGSLNMVLLTVIKVFLSLTVAAALNKGEKSIRNRFKGMQH